MSSPPPRRSRPPSNRSSLPFLPIVLGVLILGFLIGAGISLVNRNRAQAVSVATPAAELPSDSPVTAAPTVAPTPEPTDEPATAVPAATPVPEATAQPEATDTPEPTDAPTRKPAATAKPTAAPPSPPPSAPATDDASAAATRDAVTAAPAATARASAAPLRPPVAAPTRVPATAQPTRAPATAAPTAAATALATDAESAFERQATSVVRGYLAAVERGDVDGAQAQLASSRGALPEVGIVDAGTQIRNLESRGTADAVTVNVDLQTKAGLYLGQYVVHRTAGGAAVIVDHTLVKS